MKTLFLSLLITLSAYSDTPTGFAMRVYMTRPLAQLDEELAAYVALFVHF